MILEAEAGALDQTTANPHNVRSWSAKQDRPCYLHIIAVLSSKPSSCQVSEATTNATARLTITPQPREKTLSRATARPLVRRISTLAACLHLDTSARNLGLTQEPPHCHCTRQTTVHGW